MDRLPNERIILLLKWPVISGAIIYIMIGLYWYFTLPLAAGDLGRRWIEAGYWLYGYNPVQVRIDGGPIIKEFGKMSIVGGYPPWSYVYALFIAPPILPFIVVKYYFLMLNIFAIILLGFFVKRESDHQVADHWPFLFAATLCCSALPVCLRAGQYSILITVAIWGFLYFEERGKSLEAGFLLAFACIKPQVAALFFLLPLVKRSFMTCFWCVLFGAIATAIASWWCHTFPWTLVLDTLDTGLLVPFNYMGIGDPVKNIIGEKALLFSSILIFTSVSFYIAYLWRWASLFQLSAIPAVFSTIWMNHKPHDLMIISLLIVPMFCIALENKRRTLLVFAILAGLSHWLPHFDRFYLYWPIPLLYRLAWLLMLTFFLISLNENKEKYVIKDKVSYFLSSLLFI